MISLRRMTLGSGYRYLMEWVAVGDGARELLLQPDPVLRPIRNAAGVFLGAGLAGLDDGRGVETGSRSLSSTCSTCSGCQRPLGIPRWRPLEFLRDGHENSPRTATQFPGPSTGQGHHPLA